MKAPVEKQAPKGVIDYLSLAITTCGVGYLPLAPGTWGSIVGVLIYLGIGWFEKGAAAHGVSTGHSLEHVMTFHWAVNAILLTAFCLAGIWASGRSIPFFGNSDPSQAVVDEVMGQLITLTFIPFGVPWPFILAGFLLFRLFDILKPYPIDHLQDLPGGLGICADDLLAGVYAGLCLAVGYAVYFVRMIYHVLPGDAVATDFRKTGIGGRVIVCRECLIVGPVDAETPFEFWEQRAHFILSEYAEDEIDFQERVADELEKLSDVEDDDEVNLWFEYELFCQANMWFCLSLLGGSDADIYRVEPAVRSKDAIWQGFGSLTPAELRECFKKRTRFEPSDLERGRDLWQAYRTCDHDKLRDLSTSSSACFPYLAEVCDAEINKSTRPQQILLEIVGEGTTDFGEIFTEFTQRAGEYGFGDLQVQNLLDRL